MNNIGRFIYGFCDGYFGRDSYEDKIIVGEGYDWVVVCSPYSGLQFAEFPDGLMKQELIDKWSVDDGE